MKTYCLKCKKDSENLDSKIFRTENNRLIMQLKSSNCENKKSRFIKEQEAKGLLSNLGIKTPLNKERIETFGNTGNTDYIYKNELDRACLTEHDMAHGKTKDLEKRTQSEKILRDKAFKIASNPKYDGYQN